MPETIATPWTPEQVEALNRHQLDGQFHPYTCGNRNDEAHHRYAEEYGQFDHGILVATAEGWVCPVCGYRQTWAHGFSADAQARKAAGVFVAGKPEVMDTLVERLKSDDIVD